MKTFLAAVQDGRILTCDGAMGTMLFARGLQPGECPEKVSESNPDWLTEIARSYFEAGADILETNTFGGSALKLAGYGLESSTRELNRVAAEITRNIAGDEAYVAGSCGPSGKILLPYGDTSPQQLFDSFAVQMEGLAAGGVDIICVETMTDLQEARQAVLASKKVAPTIPVMATMTFDKTRRGFFTMMGVSIAEACEGLLQAGADLVGSNCGNGLDNMIEIAREFRRHTSLPLIIQSNAGLPEQRGDELYYSETPDFFAQRIPQLIEAGVAVIGGCCGTTPEHIRSIKRIIRQHTS